MANTILYDGDSERLDSGAEISRITRSGGGYFKSIRLSV